MTGIKGKIPFGSGLTRRWSKINEDKVLKKRNTRPGYPVEIAFKTKKEIDEYLSEDRITCLLCGRKYKGLGNHIQIHGYTVDAYKIKYGLPFQRGLTCPSSVELNSSILKKRLAAGTISRAHFTKEFSQNACKKSALLYKERKQWNDHTNESNPKRK